MVDGEVQTSSYRIQPQAGIGARRFESLATSNAKALIVYNRRAFWVKLSLRGISNKFKGKRSVQERNKATRMPNLEKPEIQVGVGGAHSYYTLRAFNLRNPPYQQQPMFN